MMCRTLPQLQEAIQEDGVQRWYVDFQDIREYRQATELARAHGRELYLATPRIDKPGEAGIFPALARHGAHGILARNLAALEFFHRREVTVVTGERQDVLVELLRP